MLGAVLALTNIIFFLNTDFYTSWKDVMIGGEQFSVSLSALIILLYLFIGIFDLVRWNYIKKRY